MKNNGEISQVKLTKTYGKHAVRVLGDRVKWARNGWFSILKSLPTEDEFKALQKAAFTKPITDVVENAKSELESLRDELQEWYDNLPESFQNGSKGDELQEAVSSLETATQDDLEVPEWLKDVKVFAVPGDGTSRADRGSQAAYELRQAAEALDELFHDKGAMDEKYDEAVSLRDELNSAADEAENVSYPGMY